MDTVARGWDGWERVRQSGHDTGNDEEQSYVESQCQVRGSSMFLVLSREQDRWISGKIRSRRNLTEMCPDGGELEVVVQGPNLQFHDGRRCRYSRGIWSAVWLLPDCGKIPWPSGSELDLFETMHRSYDDCNKGFSTVHFGPRGHDYDVPRRWGLALGSYVWDDGDHRLRFRWERRADRAWVLSFWVDDRHCWRFATANEGVLAATREGDFREGPGEACSILQRVFDDPARGYHIKANQALGGRPFGRDSHANLKMADFVIKGVRVRPVSDLK